MPQLIQQVIDDYCPDLVCYSKEPQRWRMYLGARTELVLSVDNAGLIFLAGPLPELGSESDHLAFSDRYGLAVHRRFIRGPEVDELFIQVRVGCDAVGHVAPRLFAFGLAVALTTVASGYLAQTSAALAGFEIDTASQPPLTDAAGRGAVFHPGRR